MAINNVAQISGLLDFTDPDHFYFLQILRRRKDNPDMKKDMQVIANYHIGSRQHLDEVMPLIIAQCDAINARAYIRLNARGYKKAALQTMLLTVRQITDEQYKAVKSNYDSICGRFHSAKDRKWIVDVDYKDSPDKTTEGMHNYVVSILESVRSAVAETGRIDVIQIIPTKNGQHIVTRPFNLAKFKLQWPTVDVHKSATTIVYCP